MNIKFTPGNCYGLIGANGAGKSTFLKILSGDIESTSGSVLIPNGLRLSVLKQDHFEFDEFEVMQTVLKGHARLYEIMEQKEILYAKPDFSEEDGLLVAELEGEFTELNGWEAEAEAAMLLNGLGVAEELHYKKMQELDGSDKVKVLLAQALFGHPDILLMDEPTNHLDLEAITALNKGLIAFPGVVFLISRDHQLVQTVANRIIELSPDGTVYDHLTTYDEYLENK